MSRLGIIAGDKSLPSTLINFLKSQGADDTVVAGIIGSYEGVADARFRLAELPKLIAYFKRLGVERVVLAGGVHTAKVGFSLKLIEFALRLLFMKNRYDGVLRLVVREIEKNGMKVVGIQEIMPQLLIAEGAMGAIAPSELQTAEINRAWRRAREFASTDVGQSCVEVGGVVVATEKFAGTNELIGRAGMRPAAVLLKMPKPAQEMRADVPVIGVDTVELCAARGYAGIAVEAGRVIVEDRAATVAAADKNKIFIVGFRLGAGMTG
ncbi:MAG: UDP-2,3-diacylglucosamine diphosphatase LpxI [Alphaproteobacteria bacterium]|nr:UDP-2,3-diacylglucosamine diphosphatase LpxI [Alphaproteobacteria bacterium]